MLTTTIEDCDGRRVRVARAGKGIPIVFLHGYPDNLQVWSRLAPVLADSAHTVAFDWPGLGESEPWSGGATPDAMAERLRRLMAHWKIERAVLVAHDMGAPPALVLAATHPSLVAGLVVMNSLVVHDAPTSWEIAILRRFQWNRALLAHAPRLVFAQALRTSLPVVSELDPDVRADLWRSFRRPEVRAFVSRMCAAYQGSLPRLTDLYRRVECPALLLWGGRDHHFPPEQGSRLAALVAAATREEIPQGHHWMAWHAAPIVADRIAAFLRSLTRLAVLG